jgi:hypothetical protein
MLRTDCSVWQHQQIYWFKAKKWLNSISFEVMPVCLTMLAYDITFKIVNFLCSIKQHIPIQKKLQQPMHECKIFSYFTCVHWFLKVFVIYLLYDFSLRMATIVAITCICRRLTVFIRYSAVFMCTCWFYLNITSA